MKNRDGNRKKEEKENPRILKKTHAKRSRIIAKYLVV
jgi:hypothetical protein